MQPHHPTIKGLACFFLVAYFVLFAPTTTRPCLSGIDDDESNSSTRTTAKNNDDNSNTIRAVGTSSGGGRFFIAPFDDNDNDNDDNNAGLRRRRKRRIVGSILPSRLVSVVGLESSGTSFLTDAFATAVGAEKTLGRITWHNNVTGFQIQHISQPTGYMDTRLNFKTTIPFMPPVGCIRSENPQLQREITQRRLNLRKKKCAKEALLDQVPVVLPRRFFVNLTSHVQWYRERGVETTVVIIMRDYTMHLSGKHVHAPNPTVAEQEDAYGLLLIREALGTLLHSKSRQTGHPELVLVSYETLVQLGHPYLFDVYDKLGIHSTHAPTIKDGNGKYANADVAEGMRRRRQPVVASSSRGSGRVVVPVQQRATASVESHGANDDDDDR